MQTKLVGPLQLKQTPDGGTFEGMLSVYSRVDQTGDMVEPGAYTKTVWENGGEIPLLWQHDPHEPIGKLQLFDSPEGLRVKGSLEMSLPTAQKVHTLIKKKIVSGLSIGYQAVKKEMAGSVRKLKEIRLFEGSVVTFGADPFATITAVKSRSENLVSASLNAMTADLRQAKLRQSEAVIMDRVENMRRLVNAAGARR